MYKHYKKERGRKNYNKRGLVEFSHWFIWWQFPEIGDFLGMLDFSYISLPPLAKRRSLSSQMKKLKKIMKWLMKILLWFKLLGELRERIICSIAFYPFLCLCSWMHYSFIPHFWIIRWHDTWFLTIFKFFSVTNSLINFKIS